MRRFKQKASFSRYKSLRDRITGYFPPEALAAMFMVAMGTFAFCYFFALLLSGSHLLAAGFGLMMMLCGVTLRIDLLSRKLDKAPKRPTYIAILVSTILISTMCTLAAHMNFEQVKAISKDIAWQKRSQFLHGETVAVLEQLQAQKQASLIDPSEEPLRLSRPVFRQALIIGNSKYQYPGIASLKNARTDAQKINQKLKRMGYRTTIVQDGTLEEITLAIQQYRLTLNAATSSLFYYAGHGFVSDGSYHLLPTDFVPGSSSTTIDLTFALQSIASRKPNSSVAIIDACRTPPHLSPSNKVNASVEIGEINTYVAMASAPGQEAYDGLPGAGGLFSQALLESIEQDLDIDELFRVVRKKTAGRAEALGVKQTPWSSNNLITRIKLLDPRKADDAKLTIEGQRPVFKAFDEQEQKLRKRLETLTKAHTSPLRDSDAFAESVNLLLSGKSPSTEAACVHFLKMLLILLFDLPIYLWAGMRAQSDDWIQVQRNRLKWIWGKNYEHPNDDTIEGIGHLNDLPALTEAQLRDTVEFLTPVAA